MMLNIKIGTLTYWDFDILTVIKQGLKRIHLKAKHAYKMRWLIFYTSDDNKKSH